MSFQLIFIGLVFVIIPFYLYGMKPLTKKQMEFLGWSSFFFLFFFGIMYPIMTDQPMSVEHAFFITALYIFWYFGTYMMTNSVSRNNDNTLQLIQPIQI